MECGVADMANAIGKSVRQADEEVENLTLIHASGDTLLDQQELMDTEVERQPSFFNWWGLLMRILGVLGFLLAGLMVCNYLGYITPAESLRYVRTMVAIPVDILSITVGSLSNVVQLSDWLLWLMRMILQLIAQIL